MWLTADGQAVLDHDGVVRSLLRRTSISSVPRDKLPEHIPTLEEFYEACGTDFELSLDVKDPAAAAEVVRVTANADPTMASRLWLCHPDWELVATWRTLHSDVRLVDSTRIRKIKEGPERRFAKLADVGIDALNMHHSDWTGGHVVMGHRFGRSCLGWDAQHERTINELLKMGIDGVFSDHVDRLMSAIDASVA